MILKNTDIFKISVINTQTVDGETDTITEISDGTFRLDGTKAYITYKTETGSSMIKLSEYSLAVIRTGAYRSKMEYTPGKYTAFSYETPYGTTEMRIFTRYINHTLTSGGGTIQLDYILETNGDKLYNHMEIRIER